MSAPEQQPPQQGTAGSEPPEEEGSLMSSLRQRLDARRRALAPPAAGERLPAGPAEMLLHDRSDGGSDEEADEAGGQHYSLGSQQQQQQQPDQLLLLDLVSFDHCQELVQLPLAIERQVLMQFDASWLLQQPLPSAARQQADALQRLPAESLGLWVPTQPRVSSASLYKLEQRLARGRRLDVAGVVASLQQQFPDARQPAADAQGLGPGGLWLDAHGLMVYEPNPAKAARERPWRRHDQDAASTATAWLPAVAAPMRLLDSRGATYRLDVELGSLEFEVHPFMSLEHQLAAKLLCAFREYHRRASLGLCSFYSQRLAALEDGLLNAREALFHAQQQQQQLLPEQQLQAQPQRIEPGPQQQQDAKQNEDQLVKLLAAVAEAEQEVAEVRQLREEEDALLLASVEAMAALWQQLQRVRREQGGRRLTDVAFSVVQLPPHAARDDDAAPLQADGLTRQQLDVALLAAEAEPIAGLPPHPAPFPVPASDDGLVGCFSLRRLEGMTAAHAQLRQELTARLQLLEDRVSADPADPEITSLRQQLVELGPVPRRQQLSHQQEMGLWDWAEAEVAAGRGSYHPHRLRPCLSVLPQQQPGDASFTAGSSAADSARLGRSRLGGSAAGAAGSQPLPMLSTGPGVAGLGSQQLLPVSAQAPKVPVRLCYYARLLVNGRVVGTSEPVQLREDFTLNFRDVFSVRLLKWPESVRTEIWEQGTFRDALVAEFYLAVPGLGGTPHVDPQAKPYSWTSAKPVPPSKLQQAIASLAPLGAVPAAQTLASTATQQQHSSGPQAASQPRAAAALTELGSTAGSSVQAAGTAAAAMAADKGQGSSFAAMYPSGRLFVRCGWVADAGLEGQFTPFQRTDGAFAAGQATSTLLQHTLRLPDSSSLGAGDGVVQISIRGTQQQQQQHKQHVSGSSSQPGSPSKQQLAATTTYSNPLAALGGSRPGSLHASPDKAGGAMVSNPLAHLGSDVEVGRTVAPPLMPMKADKALQRVARGVGHKGGAAAKWLLKRQLDPNHPRNVLLLELLRAREAAASGGSIGGAAGLFRLDVPGGALLGVDRVADRRSAFIKQRWLAGPYRATSSARSLCDGLSGARQLRVTAPLSARDTLDLQDAHREALALIEAASMGVGGIVGGLAATAGLAPGAGGEQGAAADGGPGPARASAALAAAVALRTRHERAVKWSQGALAKALEARETAFRSFALRLRAAAAKTAGGRPGCRFKTDDVVKDAPLPEFRFDLSTLAALLAPVRPLRPRRKAVKKVQATVPRDTQLVITVQRASNLPRRLAVGGAGVRAQSPNRMTGGRVSTNRYTRDYQSGGFASASGSSAAAESARAGRGPAGGFGSDGLGERGGGLFGRGQQPDDDDEAAGPRDSTGLSCFVEVQFRGRRQRTAAVDSDTPVWNEQLLFQVLDIDQEASPQGLRDSNSMITISLFDEVVTPGAAAKAMRAVARAGCTGFDALTEGGALPQRERRFLGCMRLSLAALYQAEVVDGAFKLEVPPVLFGYLSDTGRPASLALYLTLKPRLVPPEAPEQQHVSGEQGDVTRHARKWVVGISSMAACKARVVKAVAVDPDGLATLLPRYLAPTPLPPHLAMAAAAADATQTGSGGGQDAAAPSAAPASASLILQDAAASHTEQLMLLAAHWVAHVPLTDSAGLGRLHGRAWASSADVVALSAGGPEEHAHLLAGFFLELQQQAFVVLGTSLDAAQSAFVLTTGQSLASAAADADPPSVLQPPAATTEAVPGAGAVQQPDAAAQHQLLQQRLAAAAGAAQARQRAAAAAGAGNPALAAAAAAASGPMQQLNVARLRLWNPMTGHCVPVRDPACELREVGTVYSSDNLWANIQDSGHPWDISWALGDSSAWKPFFGPVLQPRELASIQVPPCYLDLDPRFYEELEASAEEAVRDTLYEARSVVVTQPNNKLSRVLKALLRELPAQMRGINAASLAASLAMSDVAAAVAGQAAAEAAREQLARRLQLMRALQVSHNDRVSREMRGCLINGHILAVPFSDSYRDALAQAVVTSGVHRTVDPRVKFAMAAYVERLGAAFVSCIWVYVAAVRETS